MSSCWGREQEKSPASKENKEVEGPSNATKVEVQKGDWREQSKASREENRSAAKPIAVKARAANARDRRAVWEGGLGERKAPWGGGGVGRTVGGLGCGTIKR